MGHATRDPVISIKVSRAAPAPVEQGQQPLPVFCQFRRPGPVQGRPIRRRHPGHIGGPLHAAFDLQPADPGLFQIPQVLQHTQVAQAQGIIPFPRPPVQGAGLSTGLGAGAPVAAALPRHRGIQTGAGKAHAQGPVDKGLQGQIHRPPDGGNG